LKFREVDLHPRHVFRCSAQIPSKATLQHFTPQAMQQKQEALAV